MADNDQTLQFRSACRYLRSKEMYYQGQDDDAFASGIYWCSKTHENFGPDGVSAEKNQCCAGRTCYVG